MKKTISPTGKLAACAAAFWATVIGGAVVMHEYIIDPAPPPTDMQRLQSEFAAAVAERAEGVEEEKKKAVLVEKLCDETAQTLTATFQNADINATFTAPYEAPNNIYTLGKCALYVNSTYLTTIDSPDEFEGAFSREYLNEQLMKNLSPAALQHLQKNLNPRP